MTATAYELQTPYLLFLGNAKDQLAAKTAIGIRDWRPEWSKGQMRLDPCEADLGLPDMSPKEAVAAGIKTLVVGVAYPGGRIPDHWVSAFIEAVEAGLDIASGLHTRLTDLPDLVAAAEKHGRNLTDVRQPPEDLATGTGEKRPGKRLLAVGTDCNLGKKYSMLAMAKRMQERGMNATFRATGQTGIFIAGSGLSVDAVVADFISGAAEAISPANDPDHWDLIEGQGSLFHPAFAGVSLGLLHGSQPDAMVMCHEPTRLHVRGCPTAIMPELSECIAANEAAASLTNPNARVIGIAVNTSELNDVDKAKAYLQGLEDRYGMPAVDPIATGVDPLIDALADI